MIKTGDLNLLQLLLAVRPIKPPQRGWRGQTKMCLSHPFIL
jgi:hypothetical protein